MIAVPPTDEDVFWARVDIARAKSYADGLEAAAAWCETISEGDGSAFAEGIRALGEGGDDGE